MRQKTRYENESKPLTEKEKRKGIIILMVIVFVIIPVILLISDLLWPLN